VLFVGMLGLTVVAAAQRALDQHEASKRGGSARDTAAQPRESELRPLESIQRETETRVPDAVPTPGAAKPSATPPPKPVAPPKPEPSFSVARVKAGRTVELRSKPGGPVLESVGATTEFGSTTTLAVAQRRGRWLGVTSTEMPNGKLAWVREGDSALQAHKTHLSVRIDLSRRLLELRDGRKVVRRASVGVGRPGSHTPTGRFSVTDKMPGSRYGSFYGCCIVALSGHQPNLPAGWRGGDRLAIHGTSNPATIGVPSSAGCLHADERVLRLMMRRLPLGTPVFIRA
jgi:lipoprotein-anchoring transpeptidase ErfK/SrfK